MPAPAKTTDEHIVAAALALAKRDGRNFSINTVATNVGVRPASLYKRFSDRNALLAHVQIAVIDRLGARLSAVERDDEPLERVRAMARAYVAFALDEPKLYDIIFAHEGDEDPAVTQARRAAVAPALDALGALVGTSHALDAARAFTAFLHGYVSMRNAGAFHLGGDIDRAFDYGLEALLRGLRATKARRAL